MLFYYFNFRVLLFFVPLEKYIRVHRLCPGHRVGDFGVDGKLLHPLQVVGGLPETYVPIPPFAATCLAVVIFFLLLRTAPWTERTASTRSMGARNVAAESRLR